MWTEDCWKLEGANGVTFNPTISYLLVKHKNDYLILAEKRLGEFIARVGNGKSDSFKTLLVLNGQSLNGMTVRNPLNGTEMPLVPDATLKPNFGSGLHTVSPAHNIQDLKLSYMHSLPRDGVLSSRTGFITRGAFEGVKPGDPKILSSLQKQDFYFANWKHQNPSFQTSSGEPVYLLSIEGWFFKISDQLKYKCFGELQKVKFVPDLNLKSSEQSHKDLEKAKRGEQVEAYYLNVLEELNDFSEWCISEEGSWGIPIPYFERIGTGEILSSPEITRHVANVIRQHGGSDAWYNLSISDLLPTRHKAEADQFQKG